MKKTLELLHAVDLWLSDRPEFSINIAIGCGGYRVDARVRGDVVFKTKLMPDYQLEEGISLALDYCKLYVRGVA